MYRDVSVTSVKYHFGGGRDVNAGLQIATRDGRMGIDSRAGSGIC